MKQLLGTDTTGSYAFDKTAKTVTFSGLRQSITLSNILLITNVTANTIIYNFADSTKGAVSFNNNVLTLDYDTSSMANTDVLQIFLDLPSNEESLHDLLRRMNKLLESNTTVDLYQRQKVVIEAVGNSRGTPTEVATSIPISGGPVTSSILSPTGSVSNAPNVASGGTNWNPYSNVDRQVGMITETPVSQLWRVLEDSRISYASAIRSKLTFS